MEKAHPAGSWKPCLQQRNGGCGCTESALQYKPWYKPFIGYTFVPEEIYPTVYPNLP